jgi:hypothetical protein
VKVLLLESNLMWSARLAKSLVALGHEVVKADPEVAIINLGELGDRSASIVSELHRKGVKVIAHAGHKETELLSIGRESGADMLATNSQLTFKLADLLQQAESM